MARSVWLVWGRAGVASIGLAPLGSMAAFGLGMFLHLDLWGLGAIMWSGAGTVVLTVMSISLFEMVKIVWLGWVIEKPEPRVVETTPILHDPARPMRINGKMADLNSSIVPDEAKVISPKWTRKDLLAFTHKAVLTGKWSERTWVEREWLSGLNKLCEKDDYTVLVDLLQVSGILVDRKPKFSGRLTVRSMDEALNLLELAGYI